MAVAIISYEASLEFVVAHNTHTLVLVEANPLTQSLAPGFVTFQTEWFKVNTEEIMLRIGILKAAALVAKADDDLDAFVDTLSNTILAFVQSRENTLYQFYFGKKVPYVLKRPILGNQLETMRGWIEPLTNAQEAALQALGAQLKGLVDAADAAVKALAAARNKNYEFRTIGARKALIDQCNTLRKSTYGTLSAMPHEHPEYHLPATFAEQFFKRVAAPVKQEPQPETSDDLVVMIADAEANVATLRDRLAEVLKWEAEQAAAREKEENLKAELAELKKSQDAAKKRIAEIEAKIDKPPPQEP